MALPYYQMYPKDFNGAEEVKMMSLAGVGLYILCVNHAWIENGIPSDPEMLTVALGLTGRKARDARKIWVNEVSPKFPIVLPGGRVTNTRVERERRKAERKSDQRSMAAGARWGKTDATAYATAENLHCESASLRASDSISGSTSLSQNGGGGGGTMDGNPVYARYHDFVAQWDHPDGVDEGARSWIYLVDIGEISSQNIDEVFDGLERYKASRKVARGFKMAIPKWLNGRRWKDNPEPASGDEKWR